MRIWFLAMLLLLGSVSFAQAAAAPTPAAKAETSMDTDGNIQFKFGDTPSIKMAPAGAGAAGGACSATSAGALRYNTFVKSFEGCDGVRWRSFSDFDTRKWYDVKASRSWRTPYVNTTNHAIEVSVMTYSGCTPDGAGCPWATPYPNPSPTHCAASITVDGVFADYQFMNAPGQTSMCNAKAVVPVGSTYMVNNDGWTDIYLFSWAELR